MALGYSGLGFFLVAKRKRKRKTYDDKFRTNAVLMAETLGYPNTKGALVKAAKHMKIPHSTLSRWARGKQNPPPSQLVHEKRFDLLEEIKGELRAILGVMPNARQDADYRELATAFGIFFDKHQLLQGEPTDIQEVNVTDHRKRIMANLARESSGYVPGESPDVHAKAIG